MSVINSRLLYRAQVCADYIVNTKKAKKLPNAISKMCGPSDGSLLQDDLGYGSINTDPNASRSLSSPRAKINSEIQEGPV